MVARVTVVLFDGNRMGFAGDMAFCGQHFGKCFPIVGVEDAIRQMPYLVVEPSEGCSITIADHPGNSSP